MTRCIIQQDSPPRGERGKLITVEVSVGKTCAHLQRAVKRTPPSKGGGRAAAHDDKVAKQLAIAPLGT
jgi:hypothetical protein